MVSKTTSIPLHVPREKRPEPMVTQPSPTLEQEVISLLRDLDRKIEAVMAKLESLSR